MYKRRASPSFGTPGFTARLASLGLPQGNVWNSSFRRVTVRCCIADQVTQGRTRWASRRMPLMPPQVILSALARTFTEGELDAGSIAARAATMLGRPWRWLGPLARRYVEAFAGSTRPRQRDVIQFLRTDPAFRLAWRKYSTKLTVAHWIEGPQRMDPVAAARPWNLPPIATSGDLSQWLQFDPRHLDWFADLKALTNKTSDRPKLTHYRYRVVPKSSGQFRLIEAPKPHLKAIQRQILTRILYQVPPHPSVHGFVPGRSIRTFAAPHVGRRVVLRMDLRDFFPTFAGARIQTLFRTLGYPESVADQLGGICTNAAPRHVWNAPAPRELRDLYARPHLPQGAPTSPWLANLCTYRTDCRLTGLAQSAGAAYTRYADDLAFSGDEHFEARVERFSTHVAAILHEEGFTVHHRKTRIMRQGVRQYLAGVVTNQRLNVVRADYDRLKAILTNCVRLGPDSQNRDHHPDFRAHLAGRIAFVEMLNPAKGQRLQAILKRIPW
jgi:RNA-directed DNA polymerase